MSSIASSRIERLYTNINDLDESFLCLFLQISAVEDSLKVTVMQCIENVSNLGVTAEQNMPRTPAKEGHDPFAPAYQKIRLVLCYEGDGAESAVVGNICGDL